MATKKQREPNPELLALVRNSVEDSRQYDDRLRGAADQLRSMIRRSSDLEDKLYAAGAALRDARQLSLGILTGLGLKL